MIDGNGYSWRSDNFNTIIKKIDGTATLTTEENTMMTNSLINMPTYDGKSTMVGNTGNGYAKFTYLGV